MADGDCICGNGEAEEDRAAVLRCPVHRQVCTDEVWPDESGVESGSLADYRTAQMPEPTKEACFCDDYGKCPYCLGRDAATRLATAESLNTRYLSALEEIERHHAMPAGEDWEQAYNEVCSIAIEALTPDTGTEDGAVSSEGGTEDA